MSTIEVDALIRRCRDAVQAAGADPETARVLAQATVEAEQVGNRAVGVAHLPDYLDGFERGRIAVDAQPRVERVAPAAVAVDADRGLAQTAFAAAHGELVAASRQCGVATLWIRNAFTCGELGYYARRLAAQGFVAMAMANSPALMSLGGSADAVLGTNPLAYGFPRPGQLPVVIDQASSATAYVNVRRAAEVGDPIPSGWAQDATGAPTQDARAALDGTLLPFGGHRGGNLALLVEVLATLSGAQFSLQAAPFQEGSVNPGIGVFVLVVHPGLFEGATGRLAEHVEQLSAAHGVRLPALALTELPATVEVDDALLARLSER